MRRNAIRLSAMVLCVAVGASAHASPTPEHAAACVAALKARADAMAARLPTEPAIEPALLRVLEQGMAFIGDAYLHGLRDQARADALLKRAEEAQASLPPAQLAERQAACQAEGARLLAEANALSRMVVSHAANKRLQRLKRAPR